MSIHDIACLVMVGLPVMVWFYFWTKHDLENKSNLVVIDPKTGKVVSRFIDWLSGKE